MRKFFRSYVESVEHLRPICRWRVAREADSSEAIESTPLSTIFVLTSNSQPLISHLYYVIDGFGVGGDGEDEGFIFGLLEWEFLGGAEH